MDAWFEELEKELVTLYLSGSVNIICRGILFTNEEFEEVMSNVVYIIQVSKKAIQEDTISEVQDVFKKCAKHGCFKFMEIIKIQFQN